MFLSGEPDDAVRRETSLCRSWVYQLVSERCLAINRDDDLVWGWRALVPGVRIAGYTRRKALEITPSGAGLAGALTTLLLAEPELRRAFDKRILSTLSGTSLKLIRQSKRRHCGWLIDQLRGLGYEARQEWPFNTKTLGCVSITNYINKVLEASPKALAGAVGGSDLVRKLESGNGINRPSLRFMQRVEMDAHKLDARFTVSVPQSDGTYVDRAIHRLWVVVILEVTSRAVLGYYLSLNTEVSSDDVKRAIKCAITAWKRPKITFTESGYKDGAGLMSCLGPEFTGLCWDETSVDGALAETCPAIENALRDCLGAELVTPSNSFAIRRTKDDRPFIERFFGNLAAGGFHRLSNTTGSKSSDVKGECPEKIAIAARFQYEYAEELLAALIANYNVEFHETIKRSPLAHAKILAQNSTHELRYVDERTAHLFTSVRKFCTVRGGAAKGRPPYVEFHNARYVGDALSRRPDLVGKEISVLAHLENDARVVLASTSDGASLGSLRACPPWNGLPHSLAIRKLIQSEANNGRLVIPRGADPIAAIVEEAESRGGKLATHPAYLEVRRVLSQSNLSSSGEKALNEALERNENASNDEAIVGQTAIPTAYVGNDGAGGSTEQPRPLPSRRMAIVK